MMMSIYWAEVTLEVQGDQLMVEKLIAALDLLHDGQITYTFSPVSGLLSLGMSAESGEAIEMVIPRVVGTVRTAAHEVGLQTPGWPEPVTIGDVRIKPLAPEVAPC